MSTTVVGDDAPEGVGEQKRPLPKSGRGRLSW